MNDNDTLKRTFAALIDKNNIGQNLMFVGWIEDFRDMGKIGFISVRDMTGNFQGVVAGEFLIKKKSNFCRRQQTLFQLIQLEG
jgi:aspartyl-tRNA synthetase